MIPASITGLLRTAALAVAYVLVAGTVVTRRLTLRNVGGAIAESTRLTSVIFVIIGAAAVIGWLLSRQQVPQQFAEVILGFADSPVMVLLTPAFASIASVARIDPFHFGIVITLNITIALITPPMGACVYIVSAAGNVPLVELFRDI